MTSKRESLLAAAAAADTAMVGIGVRPEPQHGIVVMALLVNGGEMDEEPLTMLVEVLVAAARVARITGRGPIYEFVADVLLEAGRFDG